MHAQNLLACQPLAAQECEALRDEVVEYSRDPMRFLPKIDEVRGVREPDPRQPGIISFLRRHAPVEVPAPLECDDRQRRHHRGGSGQRHV